MNLFCLGCFALHGGWKSAWKIDCDALTAEDWDGLALMAMEFLPPFGSVEGVPTGGLAFADALRPYATQGPVLLADDVLTTGGSLERQRAGREAIGVVAFARGPCPDWVQAVFSPGPLTRQLSRNLACVYHHLAGTGDLSVDAERVLEEAEARWQRELEAAYEEGRQVAQAEQQALREALAAYAQHHDHCDRPRPGAPCTCGLAELLAPYEAAEG